MPEGDADSVEPDSPDTLRPGTILGDYELGRALGKGGMATVYEARHRALHKRVALKVLHAAARRAELSRRFLREAENAARLSHPHVVDVSHVGTAQGMPYLVMEYLEGEDLGQYLERVGKLSVEATADLLVPVACAIAAAHESGVVHRDLKPQNIFLCKARGGGPTIPKVVDFGVSKLLDSQSLSLTDTDAIIGTPFYMSPEQAMEAKHVDARTDQFSLGVILYECVTGARPFAGDSLFSVLTAIVHVRQLPPSSLRYPMDPEFEALVERALEKKPEERFASMQLLGRELLRFASLRVQISTAAELGVAPPSAGAAPSAGHDSRPTRAQSSMPAKGKAEPAAGVAEQHERGTTQRARWSAYAGAALIAVAGAGWWLSRDPVPGHQGPPRPPALGSGSAPTPAAAAASDWENEKPSAPAPGSAPTQSASVSIEPASARVALDGVYIGTGRAAFDLPNDGQAHRLSITADGYEPAEIVVHDTPPPATLVLQRLAAHAADPQPRELGLRERRVQPPASDRAREAEGVRTGQPASRAEPARSAEQAAPATPASPAVALEPKPAPPKTNEFQAFPAARGGKRAVRPLDPRDPWK